MTSVACLFRGGGKRVQETFRSVRQVGHLSRVHHTFGGPHATRPYSSWLPIPMGTRYRWPIGWTRSGTVANATARVAWGDRSATYGLSFLTSLHKTSTPGPQTSVTITDFIPHQVSAADELGTYRGAHLATLPSPGPQRQQSYPDTHRSSYDGMGVHVPTGPPCAGHSNGYEVYAEPSTGSIKSEPDTEVAPKATVTTAHEGITGTGCGSPYRVAAASPELADATPRILPCGSARVGLPRTTVRANRILQDAIRKTAPPVRDGGASGTDTASTRAASDIAGVKVRDVDTPVGQLAKLVFTAGRSNSTNLTSS